jgi:hypothetical protein
MIATISNMERCKDIPGVVMLDSDGNEWSATPGDYFWITHNKPLLDANNEPMVLAKQVPRKFVEPLAE